MGIRPNFGGLASEEQALDLILERLVKAINPREIWLFGSRARGGARPDSDFDLLVVGRDGDDLNANDYERVDQPLNGLGIGCDVVPCGADEFAEGLELPTSFVRRVVAEGRKVFEAAS